MKPSNEAIEPCPRCKSVEQVKHKLVLIERGDPGSATNNLRAWHSDHAFSVSDLKPDFAMPGATGQFVEALYCAQCGVGFVPESVAKRAQPTYESAADGWRRVCEDGTLGPLLECMANDPDSDTSEDCQIPDVGKVEVDHVEVGRAGHELLERHGRIAHIVATELVGNAQAEGDSEAVRFWQMVAASIRPR